MYAVVNVLAPMPCIIIYRAGEDACSPEPATWLFEKGRKTKKKRKKKALEDTKKKSWLGSILEHVGTEKHLLNYLFRTMAFKPLARVREEKDSLRA